MEVSVSILSKEDKFKNIEKINNSNADYIHLDIMDGKFVKDKFITLSELDKILEKSKKKLDIHLMVSNPTKYIEKLSLYAIEYITIHYEIKDFDKYIDLVKDLGFKVGLSIRPQTDVKEIFPLLNKLNLVLIMSVNPGKSGQKFLKSTKNKLKLLKEEIANKKLNTKISVDGGICEDAFEDIIDADIIVSASYALNDLNNIDKLKNI